MICALNTPVTQASPSSRSNHLNLLTALPFAHNDAGCHQNSSGEGDEAVPGRLPLRVGKQVRRSDIDESPGRDGQQGPEQ